jgi:AraC-like DNA-binding protein
MTIDHHILYGLDFFKKTDFPFHIAKYTITRNQNIRAHSHDFVEMVYVKEGSAVHELEGCRYELKAGDLFVIEPGAVHSYRGSEHMETVVFNILFDRRLLYGELKGEADERYSMLEFLYLSPFLRKSSYFRPYLILTGIQKLQLEKQLDKLLYESTRREAGYELVIKACMVETMVYLGRHYANISAPSSAVLTEEQWLRSISFMLDEYHDKTFSLETASRMCGMSVATFTMKFKQFTGLTFIEYKHEAQIKHACRLLRQTDLKIMAVAHEAGFDDVGFFHKVFRKKMGMTPSRYRGMGEEETMGINSRKE